MLYLKCKGQVVSIVEDERLADKYINANTVHFEFCERWADMKIVAQFTQGENTYDVEVDEVTNTVTMPNEITAGDVLISAFGVHPITGVRITTIPVKKVVDKSGFVGDGKTPIPPTPDLYTQLINHVDERAVAAEEEIAKGVKDYLEKNPVTSVAWDNVSGKPDSLPNPFALTINGKSYDGSSAVNMDISADGGDAAKLGGVPASEYAKKSAINGEVVTAVEERIAQITDSDVADMAEVISARTDENGVVHTSLKTRIDDGFGSIKNNLVRLGYQNYVGIGEKTVNKIIDEDGGLSDAYLTDVVAIKAPPLADKITVHNVVTTGGATYRMASLMAFYKSDGTLLQFINGNDYPKENVTFAIPLNTELIRVCVSNRSEDQGNVIISFSSTLSEQKSNSLNYCSLGDSITSGYGVSGKSYAYYLNQILGFNRFDNIAVSGKPMVGWGSTQYENVPLGTDVFTCMMGTNDWNLNYSVASFKAQYENLITNLVAKCPKIKIILLTTPHRDYTSGGGVLSGETNSNGVELSAFNDAVKELGVKYGLPVVDLYSTCGISTLTFDTFTADRLHPNEEGHKRIAELVSNEIKKYI